MIFKNNDQPYILFFVWVSFCKLFCFHHFFNIFKILIRILNSKYLFSILFFSLVIKFIINLLQAHSWGYLQIFCLKRTEVFGWIVFGCSHFNFLHQSWFDFHYHCQLPCVPNKCEFLNKCFSAVILLDKFLGLHSV